MAANGINGAHGVSRPLKAGIYAPIPSFFLPGSEDLGLFKFYSNFPRF
jgi:4-hydroxy-2-oxoglutarate aldolase